MYCLHENTVYGICTMYREEDIQLTMYIVECSIVFATSRGSPGVGEMNRPKNPRNWKTKNIFKLLCESPASLFDWCPSLYWRGVTFYSEINSGGNATKTSTLISFCSI